MFTGIIEALGEVVEISPIDGGIRLSIQESELCTSLNIGDSVAVNGTCLTVIRCQKPLFVVEAVGETLTKTAIGRLSQGSWVNLERAMSAADRFGGHIVQGHVNGVATITDWRRLGENWWLELRLPAALLRYTILEGSIALDGISLTIARLDGEQGLVGINIIPHTAQVTNLKNRRVGDLLNVEVDVIAKYVENLLRFDPTLLKTQETDQRS
ncbi:MAG TPA: riboflavin synthase [Calditrichia bacterium]|nr:riboflavin synthase [Calditrichota bacterium]HQU71997.1 riboflavin synthase [Calditrichia bacterium]HQV30642.1 riboflavin synthase [Calditrichia bacterium]